MNLWTIIPAKSLQQTKSRLANILSPEERSRLTQSLLTRTLQLLAETAVPTQIVVVSRDAQVAEIAHRWQAHWVAEPQGSGLNGAVASGSAFALAQNASHLFVLPSDLPFLNRAELTTLLTQVETAASQPTIILCSDEKQEGTNALILPAAVPFRFSYGRYSFQYHQQEAMRLGLACQIVQLPGIQFDIDTEEDYAIYQANHAPMPFCAP